MGSYRHRRWAVPAVMLVGGGTVAAVFLLNGSWFLGVPYLAIIVWAAWSSSPLRPAKNRSHAHAQSRADADDVIVYWKPGCSFCWKLRRELTSQQRTQALWVNTYLDPEAVHFVAGLNDGDVLTPTAVTGDGQHLTGLHGERHATAASVAQHLER